MNTETLNELNKYLAAQLDKLKVQSPLLYFIVQSVVLVTLVAFSSDVINVNETFDSTVILILGGLAFMSPRTSQLKEEYVSTQAEKAALKSNISLEKVQAQAQAGLDRIELVNPESEFIGPVIELEPINQTNE